MKPASTMRSGSLRSIASASAASNAARDANARWSTTRSGDAVALGVREPRGVGRLLITCVTAPSIAPASTASISAARFDPRPEMRTVMRASAMASAVASSSRRRSTRRVTRRPRAARRPDARRCRRCRTRVSPAASSDAIARVDVAGRDHEHHADAAVEDAMHLVVAHAAVLLAASRRSAAAASVRAIETRLHAVGQHPRHVLERQAAAGDVRHALDRDALA